TAPSTPATTNVVMSGSPEPATQPTTAVTAPSAAPTITNPTRAANGLRPRRNDRRNDSANASSTSTTITHAMPGTVSHGLAALVTGNWWLRSPPAASRSVTSPVTVPATRYLLPPRSSSLTPDVATSPTSSPSGAPSTDSASSTSTGAACPEPAETWTAIGSSRSSSTSFPAA